MTGSTKRNTRKEEKNVLSKEYIVALEIYKTTEKENKKAYFSKLVKNLEGKVSASKISDCLDSLLDIGILNADWKKEGSKWVRSYEIAGEAKQSIKDLYKIIYGEN